MIVRPLCAVAAMFVLAIPALAAPGDMTIATFMAKAEALKAKGPLALTSPDMKLLQEEGQGAGQAYRAELDAERRAGRPSSCPPHGARVSSEDLLGQMHSYPAGSRTRVTVRTAMADLFRAKFPCPRQGQSQPS